MKKSVFLLAFTLLLLGGCSKDSNCPDCKNGAVCQEGVCLCRGLWTGENCSEQIDPLLMTIDQLQFSKFPALDNGASWDFGSGPDLYIKVFRNGVEIFNSSSSFVQNGVAGVTIPVYLNIQDPANGTIKIELWDYDDFDADDFMGSISGFVYDSKNNFPKTLSVGCPACTVGFTLSDIDYL